MSTFLKICKLSRSVFTNYRLVNQVKRAITVSAFQLQNVKDDPTLKPAEPKDKQQTESLYPEQGLTALQREMLEFVTAEIVEERRVQLHMEPPYMIDDFVGHFAGSKVTLEKQSPNESINVWFNVSKSVPSDDAATTTTTTTTTLRSVPKFEVLITRNDLKFSICCVFKPTALEDIELNASKSWSDQQQEETDIFEIQDLSLYQNKWSDSCYTVDASLIDGDLRDLIVEMLEEKGITQDFARKLSDMATDREHALYIEFLENLSKFIVGIPLPIPKKTNN